MANEGKLSGKTALVTGSSRSLGKAIAIALAQDGANVVVNHRSSPEDAEAVAESIRGMGVKSMVAQADVTKRDDVEAMRDAISREFGAIDILVNNVGASTFVPFRELTDEDWHQLIGINLHSFFYVTQTFVDPMVQKGWGRVINVTGMAGLAGSSGAHVSAAKLAVHGFTHAIANEFGQYGITCNVLAPSTFDTDVRRPYYRTSVVQGRTADGQRHGPQRSERSALKRDGKPEEFGATAAFLCSDGAAFITGQTLLVNGGFILT